MFWDPYFGWDTHMIRSCLFGLSALCVLASFVATTEGLGWTYPYTSLFGLIQSHTTSFLIGTIFFMTGVFYYWKIQAGDL